MGNSVEQFQNSQWQKLKELNFSKRTILSLVERGPVLDIGCGDGILLEHLKRKNITGNGIDISSKAIQICNSRGLNCSQSDITDKLPFGDGSFKSVIMSDVLEHLFQPGIVLKEVHRVCNGYLFISVPNFVSLVARLQVLLGRVPENNTPRDGHVYWMTHDVVTKLLSSSSFRIEKVVVNTFWEDKFILGYFMGILKNIFPSLLGLSFIVKAKRV
jgi:methionine biosynthesis protein MetW